MTEPEARAMRDAIYGPCTDNNWEHCKTNWMRPDSIQWLKDEAEREKGERSEMTRIYECDNCGEGDTSDNTFGCAGCGKEICDACECEVHGVDNLCEECAEKKVNENKIEPS